MSIPTPSSTLSIRLVLLLFFFGSLSCQKTNEASGDTDAAALQQSFFVRYLADMGQVKAQAELWIETEEGKAYLRPPGGVAFQGSATKMRDLPGGRIRYEQNRKLPYEDGRFRFSYRDEAGNSFDRNIQMSPLDSFVLLPKQGGELLRFEVFGAPLQADEQLTVFFSDAQNKAATKTFDGPQTNRVYTISSTDFPSVAMGPGLMYLVKKKNTTDAKTGTRWDMEYYTRDQQVTLE